MNFIKPLSSLIDVGALEKVNTQGKIDYRFKKNKTQKSKFNINEGEQKEKTSKEKVKGFVMANDSDSYESSDQSSDMSDDEKEKYKSEMDYLVDKELK